MIYSIKPYQRVMPYLDNMADGLAASDIVIGSAGAISLAEITALGKPSIIIPKAYTAENHQEYNAKSIEAQGAGIAILEKELTPKRLNEVVFKLLGDRELLIDMSNASKEAGKPKAIDAIYDEIMIAYNENKKIKSYKKVSKVEDVKDKNKDKDKDGETVIKEEKDNSESKEIKTIGIKKK